MRIISKNEMRRVKNVKNKEKLARIEDEKLENFGLALYIHKQRGSVFKRMFMLTNFLSCMVMYKSNTT